jgi:hypothetical protein
VGRKVLKEPPPPPATKKPPQKNGPAAKVTLDPGEVATESDDSQTPSEGEEVPEVDGSYPGVGDLQDPKRWHRFDPADLLVALRHRYTTVGGAMFGVTSLPVRAFQRGRKRTTSAR